MSPPDSIAHYRITTKLGEGGMGAVYRASDTKLNRDVAIKVLPDSFAQDPDRMIRFAREAQVLASLNHPNIAAIYGVEERALVMELVDGKTLAGPQPVEDALPIIHQLIDALEYAHEKGIVHRDLKPANIKVTPEGRLKVLDFGLAKAISEEAPAGDPAASPTLTMRATLAGTILGTAAYMAPEQARGHNVDKRADIWAFGVVVYELVTGKQLFAGPTVSDTLAAVLRQEPDLDAVPARLRRLVRACLVRDARQRMRDIGDARLLLDDPAVTAPANSAPSKLPWLAAGAAVIAAAVLGGLLWRATRPVDRPFLQLPVDLGADAILGLRGTVAISPDGSRIAYPARTADGKQVLATRLLNQPKGSLLAGTEEATLPFFSPDGQWIGFFADNKLKKISVLGGGAVVLCDAPGGRGASWGDDGYIIATLYNIAGLSRIPDSGGEPKPVTKPADKAELTHRWPQVLPGAQAILFSANKISTDWDQANIEALSLPSGETKTVQRGGYFGRYLPSGHLVYIHEGTLFAVPFDPVRLEAKGNPAPMVYDVAGHAPSGGGQFDVSRNGILVYLNGKPEASRYPFGWMAAAGKVELFRIAPGVYTHPRLSPDGKRLAFSVGDTGEIRVFDFARETSSRISSTGMGSRDPVWSPDGKHLAYSGYVKDERAIWWTRADGSGEPQSLLQAKGALTPYSFSPDGRRLAFYDARGISMLPLDLSDPDHPKPGKPEAFLAAPSTVQPAFSPDGHWIAYLSQESGAFEVYVRPVSGAPAKWPISSGGAKNPVWSRGGRQLFYVTPDNYVMVVDYPAGGDTFSPSKPRRWSENPIGNATGLDNFDVSPDGKRIVAVPVTERDEVKGNLHLTFLLNFFDELRRRMH